jgi:diguanylate cyclase (GGDEF)-like protein
MLRGDALGRVTVIALVIGLIGGIEWLLRRRRLQDSVLRGERRLRVLVLAVVGLFVGALVANLLFSLRNTRQAVLADAEDDVQNLALAVQQQVAGTVDAVEFTMAVLARSDAVHATNAQAPELLEAAVRELDAVQAMWVLDTRGRIVHGTGDVPPQPVSVQRDHVDLHRERTTGELEFGPSLREPGGAVLLTASRRLEDADGTFSGALVASLYPAALVRDARRLDVGNDGYVALMRTDGALLHRADVTQPTMQALRPSPEFAKWLSRVDADSYRVVNPTDNIERIVGFHRVTGRPLVVVAGVGVDETLASWRSTAAAYVAGSLLLLALVGVLGARLLRELHRRAEQQALIARLERTRRFQAAISQLIVRAMTRSELFEGACQVAVRHGRVGAAWIDMLDPANGRLATVASYGRDTPHLLAEPVSAQDETMAMQTFATRSAQRSNDLSLRSDASPRRRRALELGYRSKATLPLMRRNEQIATLTLIARPAGFFTDDEVRLLEDIAADLSNALDHLAAVERVHYLALHDVLTGLPNHTLFIDRAEQRLRQADGDGERCAIVKLDIERFRQINTSAGREAGDKVVRTIARRLTHVLGRDRVLARPERDHFMFVLDAIAHESDVVATVQKALHGCCDSPIEVDGHTFHIAMRAGVSLFPDDGADTETLVRNAEAALARAKHLRERVVFYAPAMNAKVAETLAIENKLRSALERGQFVLHYQPKFDVRSGALVGLEALLRWKDPDEGLVLPGHFVPLLEETGLILPVGEWVMQEALRDYRRWTRQGLEPPPIAVNVSALQLRQESFTRSVRAAVGGDHTERGLELEITESMLMTHVESNADKLDAIRDMGVSIAIDDFGTGYSSLQYIARLPLDTLKIDRSFVSGMTRNSTDREIVASVISLAHQLHLKVVAEGVDADEQARLLRVLDCDEVQGYLFSPPLAPARIEHLMRSPDRPGRSAHVH